MNKTPSPESEDLRSEYQFDYSQAKPNRFTAAGHHRLVVVLDEDIAQVFTTPESVNKALRALIEAVPPLAERKSA
jgi:hypothetical protein